MIFKIKRLKETVVEKIVLLCGIVSIAIVGLIFLYLLKEGGSLFKDISFLDFIFGRKWYPISDPPKFGILPLIVGSIYVTAGAVIVAIPLGTGCAVYIAELSPLKLKEILKPLVELLSAIPSVVMGFVGLLVVAPWLKGFFSLPTGLTALTGSIMLALMALPTIVTISEDAISAIPSTYREASLALGATKLQTVFKAVLPAAFPGIMAAIMLGIGRAIGETMTVLMVTGNAALIPTSILQPVRTLTATIAAEMGETVRGSDHYSALFAIGLVLFVATFLINLVAGLFLGGRRR